MKNQVQWSNPTVLQIVSEEMQNSPQNLHAAFKAIASRVGCKTNAVSAAWYQSNLRDKVGTQFTTSSTKTMYTNRKNQPSTSFTGKLIHEKEMSNKIMDGLRVVIVKQYYAI